MATRPAAGTGDRIRDILAPCSKRPLLLRRVHRNLLRGFRGDFRRQVPVPTLETELLEGEDAGERASSHSPPEIREGRNLEGTVPADDEGPSRGSPASPESLTGLTGCDAPGDRAPFRAEENLENGIKLRKRGKYLHHPNVR